MENFNKFKNKIVLEILLKCIIAGFSIGLIVFSIPLIYLKVKGIEFNVLYLVLIALGVMLLIVGLGYLIFKPNKVRIAKRLDKEFKMNEKVQTMVEFENEEGFMIELQRQNTLNILSDISVKSLSMRFSIVLLILLVISCACGVTAFALPSHEDLPTVETPEPTYEVDDWTILAIKNIIDKVKTSTAEDKLKTKYISMLEELIIELETNIDKESQMKAYVIELIDDILLELDKVNTNNEVFFILKDSDNSLITSLAVDINLLDVNDIRNHIINISALINGSAEAVTEFNNDFGAVLKASNLDKNDELFKTLYKLAEDLYATRNSDNVRTAVEEVINKNIDSIMNVIEIQAENYRIAHYIEFELNSIFGLENNETDSSGDEEDDEQQKNPYEDEDKDKDENINNSGGLGTGDVLFGSNDQFFDPDKGVVEYGDVITGYYGEILGKLNEGLLDENLREYFEYYYNMLLGNDKLDEE